MLYDSGDEMRSSKGSTGLKAICPNCKSVAEMKVNSICRVCSSIDIICSHCESLTIIYKRGLGRGQGIN